MAARGEQIHLPVRGSEDYYRYRYLCRTNLYFLCQEVLKYGTPRSRRVNLAQLHQDICAKYGNTKANRNLWLYPRGHFKSTVITVGGTIQDILLSHGEDSTHDEWSIGLAAWSINTAKNFLGSIKGAFEQNILLRHLFPDVIWERPEKEAPMWNNRDGITLIRNPGTSRPEPTVEVFSILSLRAGHHYERIKVDDAVTEKNTTTPEMIAKTFNHAELMESLLAVPEFDRMDFIGTHYSRRDYYMKLKERAANEIKSHGGTLENNGYCNVFQSAATVDSLGNPCLPEHPEARAIFPEHFSIKYLIRRQAKNPFEYACQMGLDPLASSLMKADVSRIARLKLSEVPERDRMVVVCALDPASTVKRRSDYSAAIVVGFDGKIGPIILDGFIERLEPLAVARKYVQMLKKWLPDIASVERAAMQAYVGALIASEGWDGLSEFIPSKYGKKEDRIKNQIGLVNQGKVRAAETIRRVNDDGMEYDFLEIFCEQFDNYPDPAFHDDGPDVFDQAVRMGSGQDPGDFGASERAVDPSILKLEKLYEQAQGQKEVQDEHLGMMF